MKHIVFRTDASLDIGTGHVMRCLTLAEALRERSMTCRFVCRAHDGNLIDLIRQHGFATYTLPISDHQTTSDKAMAEYLPGNATWFDVDWATDAEQTRIGIGETTVDWLIVDHYTLDACWERSLRPTCHHLMVIDDLADRPHDCDIILDQNLGRITADYTDLVPVCCTILTGPQFALLRPEFALLRPYSLMRRATPQIKQILISMGGVDKDNATGRVMEALKNCPLPLDCRMMVMMGLHAPWLAEVRNKAAQMPWTTEVLVSEPDIAKLMADSDLAIGAAGTSAWERCCLGLPTLTLILADNQRAGAKALYAIGAISLLEEQHQVSERLDEKIKIMSNRQSLQKMQQACTSVTDGKGVTRLLAVLLNTNG